MNPLSMDYLLLFVCGFLLVGPSIQRDDRLTALKDATIARLALRGGDRVKLDGDYVGPLGGQYKGSLLLENAANGNRGRLRLSGEYSGILGDAVAKVRADRAKGLTSSARRLDIEGAVRGILGGAAEGHVYTDSKEGLRPFGGAGARQNLDAGFSATRLSGAGVGGRAKLSSGIDAGLAGVATEVRGAVEGGIRGPLGVGASGGFDGGFHGGVGLPIVTGGHVVSGRRISPGYVHPSSVRPTSVRRTRVVRQSQPGIYSGYRDYQSPRDYPSPRGYPRPRGYPSSVYY